MSITRAPRPAEKFYVLDKRISEDKALSWAARGMLVYLLGKPDNWEVSVSSLVNETKDSGKPTRRDGVYSLIRELEDAGYLIRQQERGEAGTFNRTNYVVSEIPHPPNPLTDEPCTDKPYTDKPLTAEPYTVEPTQVNNDLQQSLSMKQTLINTSASAEKTALALTGSSARTSQEVAKTGTLHAKTIGSSAWDAYSRAYLDRYGTEPVRNAKVNAQLSQLAKRLPENEIEHVIRWYVSTNAAFYVRSKHCVDLLLRDCEGLRTEWATGSRMTDTEARQLDQHDAGMEAARWVTENKELLRQMRREGKI